METTESHKATDGHPMPTVRHAVSLWRLIVTVTLALAVVAVTSAVAWDGEVADWEASILRFFNDWPDWLEPPLWVLQQFGLLFAPVTAGLVIVWYSRRWQHFAAFAAVAPLKLGIEKLLIKQHVERERPFVSVGSDIQVRGPAFEGLSFPSGHTTTAFATAVLIGAFLPPRWRPLPMIWAVVVGIARLYYGEHNFLDVVAGAALGTMFATVLWFALLNRVVDPGVEHGAP